jgi:phosphohistidine swiveling domain-containing protein
MEVLSADPRGDEKMQRWAADGLPVPPSWRVRAERVRALPAEELARHLRALPRMFEQGHYWVLHGGAMNPGSQRQSLLNLESDEALAAALIRLFSDSAGPAQAIIQAVPAQRAAGVLFTRHPLRQDLAHLVVEGVAEGGERQRLIFDERGTLVFSGDPAGQALESLVPAAQFVALGEQLRRHFTQPQAGEWVHDGERLWLLQTLPVGSLPVPKEAWTRRGASLLFNQALTPLWYTLAGRWLKTGFWWPLIERQGWRELAKVEPYWRQQSHLYTNCDFFRRLLPTHPGAARRVPPAWRAHWHTTPLANAGAPGTWSRWRMDRRLAGLERRLAGWRLASGDRESLWRSLMALDRLGERLAREEGELAYLMLPEADSEQPAPLKALLDDGEWWALEQVLAGNLEALANSTLRPGADPVHAPLREGPAQLASLRPPRPARALTVLEPGAALSPLRLARRARSVRLALGERLRAVLMNMATALVSEQWLAHPDDIFFLYFDELWPLWMQRRAAASASAKVIGQRKLRYLDDALTGAPDWKLDRIGFGFGGGEGLGPVLRGDTLVAGQVSGTIRRLCSAWGLNRLQPGDIVVVDQADPSWAPWLVQAGALVIAERDAANVAASLALACAIPAIWGVTDVMHSVRDGQNASVINGQLIMDNE